MGALTDLWQSERGVVAIVLILGATVLMIVGRMTIDQWIDFNKWVFVTYAASKTITGSVALVKGSGDPAAPANTPPAQAPVSGEIKG